MSGINISQWGWQELEELLQCPVCLDIPRPGVVEQCKHGHHVCSSCRRNVESCPLCKCEFYGTRNFILEELVRHYDILKNTMLLNNIEVESKSKRKKKKTPPEEQDVMTSLLRNQPPKRAINTPKCTKGTYPCRAPNCEVELPLSRLLNHVRSSHYDILTESIVDFTDIYTQTFEIPFRNKKPINRNTFVVFVSGVGLIFLNIEILRSGQLIMYLQMGTKLAKAEKFLASVVLSSGATNFSFNTLLVSTRINFSTMINQRVCYMLNKNQANQIGTNKKFSCKLTLTRYNTQSVTMIIPPEFNELNATASSRSSLLMEEFNKKMEKHKTKHSKSKGSWTSQPSSSQNVHLHNLVVQVIESLNLQEVLTSTGTSNITSTQVTSTNNKRKKKKKSRR